LPAITGVTNAMIFVTRYKISRKNLHFSGQIAIIQLKKAAINGSFLIFRTLF